MNYNFKKYCIPFAIILISNPLFSQVKNSINRDHLTLFNAFSYIKCPEISGDAINDKLKNGLKGIDNLKLYAEARLIQTLKQKDENPECRTVECAIQQGRMNKCDRAIIGSITKIEKQHILPMGNEGKEKYLLRVMNEVRYTISLKIIDVAKGNEIAEIEETSSDENADPAIQKVMQRVQEYYTPKEIIETTTIVEKEHPRNYEYSVLFASSTSVTAGSFNDIVKAGQGFNAAVGIKNIFIDNLMVRAGIGYWYMFDNSASIDSFNLTAISIQGGYIFSLPYNISLSPLFAIGFVFHTIKGVDTGKLETGIGFRSVKTYTDPFISINCEISYPIYPHFSIIFAPGFDTFFEENNTGYFFIFDLGIKYFF